MNQFMRKAHPKPTSSPVGGRTYAPRIISKDNLLNFDSGGIVVIEVA
jgi:hypothetical protein